MNNKEKVLLHKGIDKIRQARFEEALEIFERVLASNQAIPEAWNNNGVAHYSLGHLDEAMNCYNRCLALDPENLDALRNKAFLLRSQRKLDEALEVYDMVLQKGGDSIDMEATAVVLTGLGKLDEALSCLYLALEKMPMDRLENEIAAVKALMEERGIPIPGERVSPANAPANAPGNDGGVGP
ncbi:MAG: tetratricopeptide repeat protein [Methanothrix sp.]|nr:tetratricopeptide repeat protein [Methanothrix sp.]